MKIIRHAPTPQEAIAAFDALGQGYKNSVETGVALKLMLENPPLTLIIVIVIPGTGYFCYLQALKVTQNQMQQSGPASNP